MTDPEHTFYRYRAPAETARPEDHDPALARARLAPTARGRDIPDGPITVPDDVEGRLDPNDPRTQEAARYRADDDLGMAINIALEVEAPLLLTGEPGTGKTEVAYHLAWYFGIPVYPFVVRSTSTAEDLRYDFDAVAYLRESQRLGNLNKAGEPRNRHADADARREAPELLRDDPLFLTERALWRAYRASCPSVVLIDEIDKAPRDFPNDLLLELERHQFPHPFRAHEIIAAQAVRPPLVIVTSNAERRLPDAFLRRCIYHHIELTPALLRRAVDARAPRDFPGLPTAVIEAGLTRIQEIRRNDRIEKKPGTAEVLVWLSLLAAMGTSTEAVSNARLSELPALAALIKDHGDREQLD